MKKKLESELISIAHRILKLTGKEDLEKIILDRKEDFLSHNLEDLKFWKNFFQKLRNLGYLKRRVC